MTHKGMQPVPECDDIEVRDLQDGDINDLFRWRNHPDIRRNFFNSSPVSWSEHKRWFRAKKQDPNTTIYIACYEGTNIGSIRFEDKGEVIKVSIMLNPDFIGKGFGSEIIRIGTEKLIAEKRPKKFIVAEVKKENIASLKAFQKAGFKESYLTFVYSK
jgi:RimJ/RimL family protein N-acetyltransferase